MRRFLRDNGLSLVLFNLFFFTLIVGQSVAGFLDNNEELLEHRQPLLTFGEYLRDPHFWEATTENWESEFLQMFIYVVLTVFLFQKGSSESKDPEGPNEVDRDPRQSKDKADAPWPVRRGGFILKLYESSLALAFLLLFLGAFVAHGISGAGEYNQEREAHGDSPVAVVDYMTSSRFWFESFQNWQSEFLAMWAMVTLSIWLRQRGSPESKPVDSPHGETGGG